MKPSDYLAKGWCQGADARDKDGKECRVDSREAVEWSVPGAIWATHLYYLNNIETQDIIALQNLSKLIDMFFDYIETCGYQRGAPKHMEEVPYFEIVEAQDLYSSDWNDDPARTYEEVMELIHRWENDCRI